MARYAKWSEATISRFEGEGRGKGTGASYIPWVQVSDFSSSGDSRRVFSPKTGRVHHLMSTIEWHIFLLLEHDEKVADIREQFPLDRGTTQSVAVELGIKHPTYPGTNIPCVMTGDFLVTLQRPQTNSLTMVDAKSTREAEDIRSMEKLEITRTFGDGCGIPHHLVFDSMLPQNKVRFLEWIRAAALTQEEEQEHGDFYATHKERLLYDLTTYRRTGSLSQYCEKYDIQTGSRDGTGLRAVRMLLQEHKLLTDLSQPNPTSIPVSMLKPRITQGLTLVAGA